MASTIKDVAREAQVSVSTVSYALNDGPRNVPPAVKARVIQIARELDYRPNRIARSLITGRTHAIGVVPTDLMTDLARVAYFAAVFNGIVNAAEEYDHDVTLLTRSKGQLDSILDGRTDGLVFLAPAADSPALRAAQERGIPFTVVSSHVEGAPCITADSAPGIDEAIGHLFDLGHRKIAHVAGKQDHEDARVRLAAYHASMAARDLPSDVIDGDFTPTAGQSAIDAVMARADRPTALLAANDDTALGAILRAREVGLSVPGDLSVVGFDDAGFAAYLMPALTTVAQPLGEMGAAAASALLRLLTGETCRSVTFATRLVVRASTDHPTAKQ